MSRTGTKTMHKGLARSGCGRVLGRWPLFLALAIAVSCCGPRLIAQAAKPAVTPNFGQLPLSFTANQGQADASVKFLTKGPGYGLYLTGNQAVLTLRKSTPQSIMERMRHRDSGLFYPFTRSRKLGRTAIGSVTTDIVRMELKDANSRAQVSGQDPLPGTANYFLGSDPKRWRTGVPTFAKVRYTGIYPGVDLVYYGSQRKLEYDFVIAPHADPGQVELHFSGADRLKLDQQGKLLVIASNGQVAFEKPTVYQNKNGRHLPVEGRYSLLADHTVSFKLGRYDRSTPLVIDPTLSYSTYLGGSTDDAAIAIAVDGAGNTYVTGSTLDTDFPVTRGAPQTTNPIDNEVAFVAKLNAAGSLVYATYLGGTGTSDHSGDSEATGIAVDASGSAYVCGETYSNNFPVPPDAFQAVNKGFASNAQNAFVSKLSPDGTALVYSTYLGGCGLTISSDFLDGDSPLRMAVDAAGSAYVVGTAYSIDFPTTTGAYQVTNKAAANLAPNAFVTKLNPDGKSLAYSTYLGGSGISPGTLPNYDVDHAGDAGYGIAVDTTGEAYVAGYTYSSDFPVTVNSYQQVNRGLANISTNGFVSKLNATGTALLDSTYLGGSGLPVQGDLDEDIDEIGDEAVGVVLDTAGNAYVTGAATSTDFPTIPGAFQTTNKGAANQSANAFVSKLDPSLSTLIYSTYIGGSGVASSNADVIGNGEFGTGIAIDSAGDAYITGVTESRDFPVTPDAFQAGPRSTQSLDSAFFAELNPGGSALQYSTYLGGSGASSYLGTAYAFFFGDLGYDVALDSSGNVYLSGYSFSYDFPVTKDALQTVNKAGGQPGGNAYIAKFGATAGATFLPTQTTLSSTSGSNSTTFTAVIKPITGTGIPTGTVTFYVNSVKAMAEMLDQTGTASFTTSDISDTLNNVIAAYSGDTVYGASGSSLGQTPTTPPETAIALNFTTPPTTLLGQGGNGGIVTVGVVDASGSIVTSPAIPVTITISGPASYTPQTYPAVTTVNGVATFNFANYPLTAPGTYSYIATSPSLFSTVAFESVAPVISAILPNVVTVGSPDLTLSLVGNFTGFLNSQGYYVCTKSAASGTNSSAFTGTAAAITATVPARFLATAGTLQVYIGDIYCGVQNSNSVPLFVTNPLTQTTATLAIAPSPVAFGKSVTLTATVNSNAQGTSVPVTPGQVVFCNSGATVCNSQFNLGSAQLNTVGVASLPLYPGAVGVHTYEAVFLGTTAAAAATSPPQSVTVTGTYPTTTSLVETGSAGNYTLTSTVVGVSTALTPGGSVSFIDQTNANSTLGTVVLGASTVAQTLAAASGSPVAAGRQPYSVATGDFNRDGFVDFAVENYADGTVSVFLGNGDGTFKPQVTYAVGGDPEHIVAADVNGDGILDLVVANTGEASVSVLLGNGDGTFQAQIVNHIDLSAAGLVVADFNNDGKLDIATSNFYSADVTILFGNGDGTFQQQGTYATGNQPRTLTFGDFNADGNIDLAVANEADSTLSILFGQGDGTFQQQILYPTGTSPEGVVVSDFNGDGIADLVIANSGDATVGIMLGNGDGTFKAMTTYAAGNNPLEPVVADFNGDGKVDVAVENYNDGTESLFPGNGDGTLGAQTTFATGTQPYSAAIGDFNGDGFPDLVISNFGSNNETILLDQVTSTATAALSSVAVTGAAGNHNVVATYPGDTNFTTSTSAPVVLVAQAAPPPTITSISPSSSYAGSAALTVTLTGTQFVTGAAVTVNGNSQAAVFVSATQLTTTITAAELSAVATLNLVVVNPDGGSSNAVVFTVAAKPVLALSSISPTGAVAGAGNTTVTATGANFATTSVVTFNATPLVTTFVSATQLTAVIPAALLTAAGTATIAVSDSSLGTTTSQAFTIQPALAVTFTGPTKTTPGEQPPLTFETQQPYPVDLAGTMTITFAPDAGNPANPQIQFASGGTTFNFTLPANSTTTPAVAVQVGTVSGTITVTLQLTAGGVNVTPSTLAPITIVVPRVAPTITNLSFSASGNTLTVLITGYSSTREIQSATFSFTPATGASLSQKSIVIPATALFGTWYTTTTSAQFGSDFTYSQLFTLSGDATTVGGVGVTLSNSVGTSGQATAP